MGWWYGEVLTARQSMTMINKRPKNAIMEITDGSTFVGVFVGTAEGVFIGPTVGEAEGVSS